MMRARPNLLLAGLLVVLIVVAFASAVPGEFLWDDQFFVVENAYLRSWSDLPRLFAGNITEGAGSINNFYRPLQAVTHLIDMQLWGARAWGHRITNLLLDAGMGVALFFLVQSLLPKNEGGTRYGGIPASSWAAFLAVSLYLCHPLQSTAVAYISGRGDILVLLFSALAALAFPRHLVWSCVATALAILSKENGVLAPAFVLVTDWARCAGDPKADWGKRALRHLPLWGLALVYVALRLTVLNFADVLNFYRESNVLTENYSYRVYTYLSTLAKGTQLLLVPIGIHHERSWLVYTGLFQFPVWVGALIAGGALGATWALRWRRPLAAAGFAWFLGATLPTSGLLALINALIYDHWFLLPGLGLAWVLADIFNECLEKRGAALRAVVGAWIVVLGASLPMTWAQNQVWLTPLSLYRHILDFEPGNGKIMNNLAMTYADRGDLAHAEELYRRSLSIQETPEAHHNLGNLEQNQGRLEEAEKEFQRALSLNPRLYQSWTGLGKVALKRGQWAQALEFFSRAIQIYPDPAAQEGIRIAQSRLK